MPELLGQGAGALTANGYVSTAQLGPATRVRQLYFEVLNADAIVQYWKPQPGNPDAGPVLELLERRITQGSLVTVDNVAGARWRSAVPGSPATILGELDYATDPLPSFQQVTQVTLTLSILDNGVLKGAETALDFVDSSSVTWAVADVPGTKVTVSATAIGAPPTGAASGDLGGTYPGPTVTGLQGRALASTAPSTNQVIAWSGTQWAPVTQLVTSVFGRTGAVVATSGDYTAAQVTNAADKSSASAQVFSGAVEHVSASSTDLAFAAGVTGDTVLRYQVTNAGTITWGPGGATATDTALSRLAAGVLGSAGTTSFSTGPTNNGRATAGAFIDASVGRYLVTGSVVQSPVFAAAVVADTNWRWAVDSNGQLAWGTGAAAADLTLQRSVTGPPSSTGGPFLQTPNAFLVTSTVGYVYAAAANNQAFASYLSQADANPAFKIFTQGAFEWGAGGASALDLELARVTNSTGGTGTFLELLVGQGFGYGTGTGGAVTQATSFNTGVTLNKACGVITLFTSATVAGTVSTFTVTNSVVGANDVVIVSWGSGGANNNGLLLTVSSVAAGSFAITWLSQASNASATRTINFAVIKGSAA